uniref:Uncharacterized protein n=1 Tax=viral metagenome TaxID=1070528 RepID=A0A6C0CIH9_9ZZZZ
MAEYYSFVSLDGTPKFLSQQTRFKSASEVTEMRKRTVVNNYYTNYPQSQKAAYASTYTTFKAGAVYKYRKGVAAGSWTPTCITNNSTFVLANNSILSPGGEKQTPNMLVKSRADMNNPQ